MLTFKNVKKNIWLRHNLFQHVKRTVQVCFKKWKEFNLWFQEYNCFGFPSLNLKMKRIFGRREKAKEGDKKFSFRRFANLILILSWVDFLLEKKTSLWFLKICEIDVFLPDLIDLTYVFTRKKLDQNLNVNYQNPHFQSWQLKPWWLRRRTWWTN